jgi:small subunit ribosomal protein S7
MSRRKAAQQRQILPDPKYGNKILAKFINNGMKDGKKSVFEKSVYNAFDVLKKQFNKDPLELFLSCIEKVAPSVEVKSRRVGGATFQVPIEVRPARQQVLSIRWIIQFARKRKEKTMTERLVGEFSDIENGIGNALKKRTDTHKMAEANKAFSHFRW